MTTRGSPSFQPFRALASPLRLRVTTDAEGFPIIPGRYGRIEWFDGRDLAVYCDRPRLFAKLLAIPGVRRHQTGDHEMRAIFPVEALEQVAGVIQARRRRPPGSAAHLQRVVSPPYRATSRPQEPGLVPGAASLVGSGQPCLSGAGRDASSGGCPGSGDA